MTLFTCATKLDPGPTARGVQGAKAVHHAVGISRQRKSGYRPSRINRRWHKVSPLPSRSPVPSLSKKGGSTTTTLHTPLG